MSSQSSRDDPGRSISSSQCCLIYGISTRRFPTCAISPLTCSKLIGLAEDQAKHRRAKIPNQFETLRNIAKSAFSSSSSDYREPLAIFAFHSSRTIERKLRLRNGPVEEFCDFSLSSSSTMQLRRLPTIHAQYDQASVD